MILTLNNKDYENTNEMTESDIENVLHKAKLEKEGKKAFEESIDYLIECAR